MLTIIGCTGTSGFGGIWGVDFVKVQREKQTYTSHKRFEIFNIQVECLENVKGFCQSDIVS